MDKKASYYIELALGALIVLFVAYSNHARSSFLEIVNLKTYDFFTKLRGTQGNTNSVQIIEIDELSVSNLGRWPWPRALVAQLVDEVVSKEAKVIGLNIFYSETDQNQGLEEISRLYDSFTTVMDNARPVLQRKKVNAQPFEDFLIQIKESENNLNGDAILAQSIEEAQNVVLPMYFQPGEALGNNLEPLPTFFEKEKLSHLGITDRFPTVPSGVATVLPVGIFGNAGQATGHSNLSPDRDGTMRRIAPIVRYGQDYYPSFAIQLVRKYLNLEKEAFVWKEEGGFALLKASIPVDEEAKAYLEFAGPAGTFQRHSAVNVLAGGVADGAFNNKIVLIGVTAPGTAPNFVVPSGESFTGLEIWATHIENILSQKFIVRPSWASKVEWGMVALAGLVVLGLLPFIRARFSVPVAGVIFLGLLASSWILFTRNGFWVSPTYASVLLASGFVLVVGKRLVFTERGKELVEAEGLETNKMLGLSFQGQGMLDLAFEKFRKCPVDNSMKDLLYNLGLDMERKRQFTKAAAVYEHIAAVDPKFKDIKDKIDLLKKAGEGAVFGGLGKKGSDATVVVDGLGQNTTLGRYEVMKELGRGAMGIVYLGKDPKINRQVAIKTLRFEEQMDDEQMKSVKERFFREAESAGNLTHPNIIRIFDAGEDQEVAYIAMELLEGEDLKKYCDKNNLLPIPRVIEMIGQVADALDYAHRQGVVHRDIKPGNLMLLKDGSLRITDFGIARIQATSKTATGAVLGTPAYMSPEQVNGKKVDGRADIFSLGVTLYEMLAGEKPFHADSIAALLYRIANVDHPDVREFRPSVPKDVIPIINKALAKEPEKRYQTAGEMAAELRQCLKNSGQQSPTPADKTAQMIEPTVKDQAPKADGKASLGSTQRTEIAKEALSPEKKLEVLSELKQAINNDGAKPAAELEGQNSIKENGSSPQKDMPPVVSTPDFMKTAQETVVEEKGKSVSPLKDIEKTVTWSPSTMPSKDIPTLTNIEGSFETPKSPIKDSSEDQSKTN